MIACRYDMSLTGAPVARQEEILTDGALGFLRTLHSAFEERRQELLKARRAPRPELDFLPETRHVRDDPDWRVAGAGPGLENRTVEITGPVDRKMTINALNSGARAWMADFEDSTAPTWRNVMEGQVNLKDAVRRTISLTTESKSYELRAETDADPLPTLVVRPRGWHLDERHVRVHGVPMSGSLVDFGLFFFHNARELVERGRGPYFYLPKLESHLEARLWNDVFRKAEQWLGLPVGTIRATVLIETITAAFEMEEILYELREHAAGLNAGRWDYIFSTIKRCGEDPSYVLPDRSQVTMTVPFMRAYTELLVRTCHKRGAHAIGGMAAVIPSKDAAANEIALGKVRDDKAREAGDGFDGSWVAHPGLVEVCRSAFVAVLGDRPNQLDRLRPEVDVTATDLLAVGKTPGSVTLSGVRTNVAVMLQYLDHWLDGAGAVAINGLMEDAATAEISRCQLWQWIRHETPLSDGGVVTRKLVTSLLEQELSPIAARHGIGSEDANERVAALNDLFRSTTLGIDLPEFVTSPAYRRYLASA
jgi:malate synthase